VRRSGRLHTAPDPVFSSSLAEFAQLALRPQQQKQRQKRPATAAAPAPAATQLNTPPQCPGPRQRGLGK
jgi:hypothetical protein